MKKSGKERTKAEGKHSQGEGKVGGCRVLGRKPETGGLKLKRDLGNYRNGSRETGLEKRPKETQLISPLERNKFHHQAVRGRRGGGA